MKKKIIASIIILLAFCLILGFISNSVFANNEEEKNYTKAELITLINETQIIKDTSHEMAENARALGWQEEDSLIKELQDKWFEADANQKAYQNLLSIIELEEEKARKAEEDRIAVELAAQEAARQAEEARWASKAAEYPAATQIWRYMKSLGWNDYVCAGIMGNLMAEVGGQTLDIQYWLYGNGYYGMCQWNRAYSQIWGADLESQCVFLKDTIKYEFDTYGFKYQKGFNFNSFLNMSDASQAALAFAKSYERCGSGTYTTRQNNAIKAYNYFVN